MFILKNKPQDTSNETLLDQSQAKQSIKHVINSFVYEKGKQWNLSHPCNVSKKLLKWAIVATVDIVLCKFI